MLKKLEFKIMKCKSCIEKTMIIKDFVGLKDIKWMVRLVDLIFLRIFNLNFLNIARAFCCS